MDDLTTFVTARLDEDAQWAKDLIAYGPGDVSGMLGVARRVLRDVDAKRALLYRHEDDRHTPGQCSNDFDGLGQHLAWPCVTIRIVAAVWSDHPGYRQEWAV